MKTIAIVFTIVFAITMSSCNSNKYGFAPRADHLATYKNFHRKHQKAKIRMDRAKRQAYKGY